ncbi:DNA repair protein XRCC2 [Heteronotia binoei]|uniref:DNA repair protein XRCC2 n=1 Tax=Heteronotia binoei TaxID=13085 RepID=UPI0029317B02|nr:DNA repair protein XRCC2 [Heteronotia binoei]
MRAAGGEGVRSARAGTNGRWRLCRYELWVASPQLPAAAMVDGLGKAESGAQLLTRLEGRSSLKKLEPYLFAEEGYPIHGDVVEFHGPEGTGKTEMLYHLVVRCILPKAGGGLEVSLLFIDTDFHFDMLRLVTVLEHRLPQSSEGLIKQCLGRFFLVSCNSSAQLLLTLYSLENMFCSHPSLCLLMIDSMSAFYWTDRANGGENLGLQEANMRRCVQCLEKLIQEYHLTLFATTQTIMRKSSNSAESSGRPQEEAEVDYRPYLCKSWRQLITHRIFLSRQHPIDSAQGFSITSCHIRSNSVVKRPFSISEHGIQF